MSYGVTRFESMQWTEREPKPGEAAGRLFFDVTEGAALERSRARIWRYPPRTTGRRHRDHAQEEVFVVISGTLTMLLGDGPERVDVGPGGVVAVRPLTALQPRNESEDELVMFVYGAPPVQEGADFLDDVPLPERQP